MIHNIKIIKCGDNNNPYGFVWFRIDFSVANVKNIKSEADFYYLFGKPIAKAYQKLHSRWSKYD